MTKPTKWPVRPAKTQISLGICPVWSVFAVRMKKLWMLSYHKAHSKDWSDCPDAEADLSLCWAYMTFCWFCRRCKYCFGVCLVRTLLSQVKVPDYRKFPKYSDTPKICCNHSNIWDMWLYHRVMSPNDADWMANSVDRDQTAPLGAVWSGSALFAQAYLSENLGSLR